MCTKLKMVLQILLQTGTYQWMLLRECSNVLGTGWVGPCVSAYSSRTNDSVAAKFSNSPVEKMISHRVLVVVSFAGCLAFTYHKQDVGSFKKGNCFLLDIIPISKPSRTTDSGIVPPKGMCVSHGLNQS